MGLTYVIGHAEVLILTTYHILKYVQKLDHVQLYLSADRLIIGDLASIIGPHNNIWSPQ